MILTLLEGIIIRIPKFWFSDQAIADLQYILQIWIFATVSTQFFNLLRSRLYRIRKIIEISMLPGIIIHEIAHALGCLITFTKIGKIVLFKENQDGSFGGYVNCETGNKSPLVNMIISFAPLIAGSVIFYFANRYLEVENLSHVNSALIAYATISIACVMGPSYQDLKVLFHNAFSSLGKLFRDICVIGCSLFIYAAYGQNFTELLGEIIFVHFIIILLIVLLINIIITIITKIIKKLLNPGAVRGELMNPMMRVNDLQVRKRKAGHTGYLEILRKDFEISKEEREKFYDRFIDENL